MLTLDSLEFQKIIHNSQALRGQRRFDDALASVTAKLSDMVEDCFENAFLEIIYAAREGGRPQVAREYALRLQKIDPNIPAVKSILG